MAFIYKSRNGQTLSKSQEELLSTIENLPFPFGGISKLKELRHKVKMIVSVQDRWYWKKSWEGYIEQYWEKHPEFFMGKHGLVCHRHQGRIGDRRMFAEQQIKMANEADKNFLPVLGLYSRTYKWWAGKHTPRVCLIYDNIKDYAHAADVDEDIVFGFVFIQQMMHAYFDAFNSKGFPAELSLEESFSEFGMLLFIDNFPFLRRVFFPFALDYVISKIGKVPHWGGFGVKLYYRAGDDAMKLIRRYRDVSNWLEPPLHYCLDYWKSMDSYEKDPSDENAEKVYEYVIRILNMDWEEPLEPIQPNIGKPWDFDR